MVAATRIHMDYAKAPRRIAVSPKLNHRAKFVADMDRAIEFYRDTLGFP